MRLKIRFAGKEQIMHRSVCANGSNVLIVFHYKFCGVCDRPTIFASQIIFYPMLTSTAKYCAINSLAILSADRYINKAITM